LSHAEVVAVETNDRKSRNHEGAGQQPEPESITHDVLLRQCSQGVSQAMMNEL
jgi:hypothetical protein